MSVQFSRRPVTVAEYDRMVETGILRDDDHYCGAIAGNS